MQKNFLILQGPHGTFFAQLADILLMAGSKVRKIFFNAGDRYYWRSKVKGDDFLDSFDEWPAFISEYLKFHQITDIVLYGDAKPFHKPAITIAKTLDIKVHCFEEGYLRPYWITYERGGSNGNSPLIGMSLDEIRQKRAARIVDLRSAPPMWGALWAHKWAGFVYHAALWFGQKNYPNYSSPRDISVLKELQLNFMRLILMPYHIIKRNRKTRRFLRSGHPFFAVMLQLEHDMSFRTYSTYHSQSEFIEELISEFSSSAPGYHNLVFKLHPLDDGRVPIETWIRTTAKKYAVTGRVNVLYGGRLGSLLNRAKGVLAINSTSVQHALWRGIPVKLFGKSIFAKPELCPEQSLGEFFQNPIGGSKEDYLEYRTYLLETSQISGGYYTSNGRAEVLRKAIDLLLANSHPYDR